MDYRELKKSIQVQSRSLFDLSCAYEENCLSSTAARYVIYPHLFQRTLMRFTSRFWNRGTAPFVPIKEKGHWIWHDCHAHYHSMERFSDYDLIGLLFVGYVFRLKVTFRYLVMKVIFCLLVPKFFNHSIIGALAFVELVFIAKKFKIFSFSLSLLKRKKRKTYLVIL